MAHAVNAFVLLGALLGAPLGYLVCRFVHRKAINAFDKESKFWK